MALAVFLALFFISAAVGASKAETAELAVNFQDLGSYVAETKINYFLITDVEVDWDKALKVCQAENGQLVRIESPQKDISLQGFLAGKGHKSAWTAGNDLLKNGEYNWAPSYELFGEYTNFRGGAAPLIPDCACIGINARKEDDCGECIGQYKWDEEVCATLKRAVCELTVYK